MSITVLISIMFSFILSTDIVDTEDDLVTQDAVQATSEPTRKLERLINSWDADDWRYSHAISIKYRHAFEADSFICGGSLLTKDKVLTACHCLLDKHNVYTPIGDHYVKAGTHNLPSRKGSQIRGIRRFLVHPKCNATIAPSPNDVGLIFVKEPFLLNNKVRLVKFISSDKHTLWWWLNRFMSIKKICHVVGWGYVNKEDHTFPDNLQDARVQLVTKHDCKNYFCNIFNICGNVAAMKSIVCALPYEDSSVCGGDSGGPLICNEYLFGVTAGSNSLCSPLLNYFCEPLTVLDFIKYHVPDYEVPTHPSRQDPPSTVPPFKYPYVVSITNITNKYIPVSLCAGSILTASTVITTCACLRELPYSRKACHYRNVAVIAGITKAFEDSLYEQRLDIVKIVTECQSANEGEDIGIAFVNGNFVFSENRVQRLIMPPDDVPTLQQAIKNMFRSGGKCFLATWGYSVEEPTKIRYNVFSEWEVKVLRPKKCRAGFCREHHEMCNDMTGNANRALCGEAYNTSQLCFADTGGPLICDGLFFGVVSYNGELCSPTNIIKITSVLTAHQLIRRAIPNYKALIGTASIESNSRTIWSTLAQLSIPLSFTVMWL